MTTSRVPDIPKNMREYFLGLLKRGEQYSSERTPERWELQCDHLAYLRSQVEAGRYFFGGPVTDGGAILGVTVIQAGSVEEAEAIMAADPGVQAGLFSFDVHPVRLPSLESLKVEY